jgi:IclR family transcriptional regulator, positive regulator for flagellar biogenesis
MPRNAGPQSKARPPRRDTVSALARGIAVLRCFGEGVDTLSHGDIARQTRIPKPTVTRLVATLETLGFLRQKADGDRYTLAAGVLPLARAFLSGLDMRASARPHMMALADEFDASVNLAVCEGAEMVVIEACRTRTNALTSRLDIGSRLRLTRSALGRAYLGGLAPAERESALHDLKTGAGSAWRRESVGLEAALRDAALRGYCISLGESHPDVSAVAVPLRTPGGGVMTLNCGGPSFRFTEDKLRRVVAPRLIETAARIAEDIGSNALNPAPRPLLAASA